MRKCGRHKSLSGSDKIAELHVAHFEPLYLNIRANYDSLHSLGVLRELSSIRVVTIGHFRTGNWFTRPDLNLG